MVYAEGVCMKHNKRWRSTLEWLTNQFRKQRKDVIEVNRLKMEEFVTSFMNLMCTCDIDGQKKPQLKEVNDVVWRDVTEDDFKASVVALKNYNLDADMKTVVQNLLKLLYGQHALFENNFEFGIKGAYRLTHLISKIIWNDFAIHHKYFEELVRRTPKIQTFHLVGFPVVHMNALLDQGPSGSLLQHFDNENNCETKLEKVTKPDGTMVVSATIKKLVDRQVDLNETFRLLKKLATETADKATRMEVDSNTLAESSATQQFVPQHTTQPFVPQTDNMQDASTSTSNVQNLSTAHSSMEIVEDQGHSSMETDTQSDVCLVHSLAWMSTYQFVLNQIINHELLLGTCGHPFSNKICTCNNGQGNTEISQFFSNDQDILTKIGQVKDELKSWRNGIIVTQKLINEMEKEQAKSWQSLLRFVHQFLELKQSTANGAPTSLFS